MEERPLDRHRAVGIGNAGQDGEFEEPEPHCPAYQYTPESHGTSGYCAKAKGSNRATNISREESYVIGSTLSDAILKHLQLVI
jgi:hypothetical protein